MPKPALSHPARAAVVSANRRDSAEEAKMRFQPVQPSRQTDANREFEDPRTEPRIIIVVLIVFTIIAFFSAETWG
jgi:hypothetical protein